MLYVTTVRIIIMAKEESCIEDCLCDILYRRGSPLADWSWDGKSERLEPDELKDGSWKGEKK